MDGLQTHERLRSPRHRVLTELIHQPAIVGAIEIPISGHVGPQEVDEGLHDSGVEGRIELIVWAAWPVVWPDGDQPLAREAKTAQPREEFRCGIAGPNQIDVSVNDPGGEMPSDRMPHPTQVIRPSPTVQCPQQDMGIRARPRRNQPRHMDEEKLSRDAKRARQCHSGLRVKVLFPTRMPGDGCSA